MEQQAVPLQPMVCHSGADLHAVAHRKPHDGAGGCGLEAATHGEPTQQFQLFQFLLSSMSGKSLPLNLLAGFFSHLRCVQTKMFIGLIKEEHRMFVTNLFHHISR